LLSLIILGILELRNWIRGFNLLFFIIKR